MTEVCEAERNWRGKSNQLIGQQQEHKSNLSNRSSGVQISRDICTRFERYLYFTKCSWIIRINIIMYNEMFLSSEEHLVISVQEKIFHEQELSHHTDPVNMLFVLVYST